MSADEDDDFDNGDDNEHADLNIYGSFFLRTPLGLLTFQSPVYDIAFPAFGQSASTLLSAGDGGPTIPVGGESSSL